jgi:Cu(I)/Ag(I) efflux system membrane fusion protein
MKKRKIAALSVVGLLVLGGTGTLFLHQHSHSESEKALIDYYTCTMHPFIHQDKPGNCPICGMTLVPVYKDVGAALGPPHREGAASSTPTIQISSERQQLIGVTVAAVEKKSVSKEIRTVGRVAFDPDLAIAQQEFLSISQNVPSLRIAAVQRLKLLGMNDAEIRNLEKKGHPQTNLYLPEKGDSLWIYAPIYEYEIPFVKVGSKATALLFSEKFNGIIRSIDPVVDPMTRSVRIRIEVPNAGDKIKPESFLDIRLQSNLGEQLVVPKSSVIDTGTRQIVFVVHDGNRFETREVKLGPEAGENRVILEGVTAGEKVASSAAFLIDSESQLKQVKHD